eukprot:4873868-Pyramimonas_sp.AAC.1
MVEHVNRFVVRTRLRAYSEYSRLTAWCKNDNRRKLAGSNEDCPDGRRAIGLQVSPPNAHAEMIDGSRACAVFSSDRVI